MEKLSKIFLFFIVMIIQIVNAQEISFELLLNTPNKNIVEVTHAGDDRLFAVNKNGTIEIISPEGEMNSQPFLDINHLIDSCTFCENGLLGLAFHPEYSSNGFFFVFYTDDLYNRIIARYQVSENPDIAQLDGTTILTIPASSTLHFGGKLAFDKNGYLWISSGTGNGFHAQDLNYLVGKILRIDVNAETYTIPPDNPFIGVEGAREEIWAYGLRNPWKFSFDELNDQVWISDVGDVFEEINKVNINSGGLNYGFPCFQGDAPLLNCEDLEIEETELPLYYYERIDSGQAVIGGYVYRGHESSPLFGKYIFGDYFGKVMILNEEGEISVLDSPTNNNMILAFGKGFDNTIYLCGSSQVYKIIDNSMSTNELNDLEIKIYPNPVLNQLNIITNKPIDKLSIYTIEGKLLQTLKGNLQQIDLSNYANGVYMIKIHSGEITKTHKIVKK